MNSKSTSPLQSPDPESEEPQFQARKIPSVPSLLHILWLRKWMVFAIWLVLAIPAGMALSIFDLPRTYTAMTVMRFPQVVGAQTNVMRDVAITEGQSIISIFNSYQVLDATIRKLSLRMRITTAELFQRDVFKDFHYGESLGPGTYTVTLARDGNSASLAYKPRHATSDYNLFSGPIKEGRLAIPGLEMVFAPEFMLNPDHKTFVLELNPLQETFEDLRKNLTPRSLGGGGNFQIVLKDRDPYLVADILNTLREQFLTVYYGTTEVQDVGILVQMEKDLELAKARLETSQDELSKYFAIHPELTQQAPNQGDNLAYLDTRRQIDDLDRRIKRVQEAYTARDPNPTPEKNFFWANQVLAYMAEAGEAKANILRASLSEVESRQQGYVRTLAPNHPKVQEAEAEKDSLYRQVDDLEVKVVKQLQKDLADLKIRASSTAPRTADRAPMKVTLELQRLNNVNSNNQNIYDRLLESYNRAKLVTGSEFFKVSVVDPARAAIYEPPSLRTRLLIASAAVLFLMVMVPAGVIGWSIVFIKIWTKDDAMRLLDLKNLGVLEQRKPRPRRPGARKPAKNKPAPVASAPAASKDGGAKDSELDPMLIIYGTQSTPQDVESYRSVREEVENLFRNPAHPGKYCLLVTSCRPHEGKSTCAANLAITFARKGKRTLLVDADFRLGRVAKIFRLNVATGIDTLLDQGDISSDQFLESAALAFQTTPQRNLVVAPRQAPKSNASELISSDRFKAFIQLAREQFDVVVLDTPPVRITPEPLALAELADGIVFVVRSGITSAAEARDAVASLRERNIHIGALLNGVKASPFEENRYKKYSYYYQVQPTPGDQGA